MYTDLHINLKFFSFLTLFLVITSFGLPSQLVSLICPSHCLNMRGSEYLLEPVPTPLREELHSAVLSTLCANLPLILAVGATPWSTVPASCCTGAAWMQEASLGGKVPEELGRCHTWPPGVLSRDHITNAKISQPPPSNPPPFYPYRLVLTAS